VNYRAEISISSLALGAMSGRVLLRLQKVQAPVHAAMAGQFYQCTLDNFGASGSFRIHQWAKLSPAYARKVRRDYATLNVTGKLRSAIKKSSSEVSGRVSVSKGECEYALVHQFGGKTMPDRPYFPIHTDGSVLGSVKTLVREAAQLALTTNLRNR
jgi:phage gpG-like protein